MIDNSDSHGVKFAKLMNLETETTADHAKNWLKSLASHRPVSFNVIKVSSEI